MRCMAESNPPAKVWWEKEGVNGIFSPDKEITISPVTRTTAGTYKCVAQNALGMSEPAFVEVDVKCELFINADHCDDIFDETAESEGVRDFYKEIVTCKKIQQNSCTFFIQQSTL